MAIQIPTNSNAINPISLGQSLQKKQTPFVIAGLKANQPGGLGTIQTNTIPKAQTAKPQDQQATGNAQNKNVTAGSTGTLLNNTKIPVPQANPNSFVAQGAGSTIINGITGQTALQAEQGKPATPGITGTSTIPSGATVDSTTGNVIAPPPATGGNPYIQQVAGSAGGNQAIGQTAANIANDYGQKIAQVGQQGIKAQAGYETTGTTPVGEGNAAVIAQSTAAQQQALAQGEQAALLGTGQQLTAQQQQTAGLTSAANLAQPTSNFPFVFNPTTGTFSTPGASRGASTGGAPTLTYNPQQDATNLAQLVIAGKIPYSDAVTAMGYAGTTGTGTLQTAITSQGGNITQIQAQNAATQSNIQTAGTAQTNAANTGYQQAVQDYGNMNAVNSAADAQISQVKNVLTQTGLNQNIPDANVAINTLKTRLGDSNYTKLLTSVTELQNMYSQLLTSGGTTPTGSEAQSLSLLNPNSSANQINAAIGQLQVAAYNRLNAQYGKLNTFQQNLEGGNTNQTNGTTNTNQSGSLSWDNI